MFGRIAAFELRYQLRQPTPWVCFAVFFLFTFLAMTVDNVRIGAAGSTFKNSPFAIMQTVGIMSLIGLFIPLTMLPGTILRDPEMRMAGIMYSLPLNRASFLSGRYAGAMLAVLLAFTGAPLGSLVGSWMWWIDPESLGPTRIGDYLYAFSVFALPNLLIIGALFFTVAAVARSQLAVYVSMITLLVLWTVSGALLEGPETQRLEAMIDPFGLRAFGQATRYWTAFERNSQLLDLVDVFLWNRVAWVTAAVAAVVAAMAYFRFETEAKRPKAGRTDESALPPSVGFTRINVVPASPGSIAWQQLRVRSVFEARSVIVSPGFLVMLALGLFNILASLINFPDLYGTPTYPVTRAVASVIAGSFSIIPVIVTIYYVAELVWRDRQFGTHEIITASPVPGWVFVVSKLLAITLVLLALLTVGSLTGISFQLISGFRAVEPQIYLVQLFLLFGVPMVQVAVLAMLIQVLVPNKYLGMLFLVGFQILQIVATELGLVDNLALYAGSPSAPYSDMNGWGHFIQASSWFMLYWSFAALGLMVLAHRLWQGAVPTPLPIRLRQLAGGWNGSARIIGLIALLGWLTTGLWIGYNTHGLNEVVSGDTREERRADFEKKYVQYLGRPQPTITDVRADIDLYPSIRSYVVRGSYKLQNQTDADLTEVHLVYDPAIDVVSQSLTGAGPIQEDRQFNYFILPLTQPMKPGEVRELVFETRQDNPGFKNDGDITRIVFNGSFVPNDEATPFIGFPDQARIRDRATRRKYGLEPIEFMAKLEDTKFHGVNFGRPDSHWVNFETTISTEPDQIAVAPGYLQREWVEGDRRYFHYRMNAPILNFYSWLSARYTVAESSWNDVKLSVLHHPTHAWNVPAMMKSMKASLDYFTAAFGPYQHQQMRILEFPAYASFAQSFPNTVPYSEAIGFVADNSDPKRIDYVFYVTAHEMAHQWWAHQVAGAAVQGSTMLSETFSQYSALMVMEKEYGPDKIRKFLKYELDRYLRGRGGDREAEQPLYRVENQQYVHYRKGSMVMYALKDAVGEDTVNRALARLVRETAYRSKPYPISTDFLRILREEVGPAHQELVTDLFEKIVLYDLKVKDHTVEKLADDRWKVRMTLATVKLEADGKGKETPVPLNAMIDIGVFAKDPADPAFSSADVLYLQKHPVNSDETVIELEVKADPRALGIDPYIKLIDRNPEDNLVLRKVGSGS
jgi:ABC-2 type transport system permease protein